ncbi:hypothetical protein ACOSQ2_003125 [Xanthoceras sorbifolium]
MMVDILSFSPENARRQTDSSSLKSVEVYEAVSAGATLLVNGYCESGNDSDILTSSASSSVQLIYGTSLNRVCKFSGKIILLCLLSLVVRWALEMRVCQDNHLLHVIQGLM